MQKTSTFSTSSGDYLSVLLMLWLPRYGWTVILPVIAFAIIGVFFDERFLLVALMLVFIVIPMLMSFLYTYYMLTPEARRTVLRKEVIIDEGKSLKLLYLSSENLQDEIKSDSCHNRELLPVGSVKQRVHKTDVSHVPPPEIIPWSDIKFIRYTSRFRVYVTHGPRLMFILVPHSALC